MGHVFSFRGGVIERLDWHHIFCGFFFASLIMPRVIQANSFFHTGLRSLGDLVCSHLVVWYSAKARNPSTWLWCLFQSQESCGLVTVFNEAPRVAGGNSSRCFSVFPWILQTSAVSGKSQEGSDRKSQGDRHHVCLSCSVPSTEHG